MWYVVIAIQTDFFVWKSIKITYFFKKLFLISAYQDDLKI